MQLKFSPKRANEGFLLLFCSFRAFYVAFLVLFTGFAVFVRPNIQSLLEEAIGRFPFFLINSPF